MGSRSLSTAADASAVWSPLQRTAFICLSCGSFWVVAAAAVARLVR